jgi:FAD/FMN-containing dehydrogenase
MSHVTESLTASLRGIVGPTHVVTEGESLETLSKDFYWYSPVLKRQLDDKRAELVVRPASTEELAAVLSACSHARVPVVPRGGGTGNYGQCVPLFGGVVVDLSRMDKILEITADGVVCCQPGARLGVIEPEARKQGWELRCMPSTWVKSSMAGFFCGGSGGIGSITWGGIASPGNVKSVTLMTCEDSPRVIRLEETDSMKALHTYGTTGLMIEIEMRLAPKIAYEQVVISAANWDALLAWTDRAARNTLWPKRLVSQFEWPIPSYFKPMLKHLRADEHATFLLVDQAQGDAVAADAAAAGLNVAWRAPLSDPPKPPMLTDYTWNHTTLWAMKSDPQLTYTQAGFGAGFSEQIALLKQRFPGEILLHFEWVAGNPKMVDENARHVAGENITLGSIPLIRFTTEDRLEEIMAYCREIGVFIANPHTYKLEEGGGHPNIADKRALKSLTDPHGLLNPGKMATYPLNPFAGTAGQGAPTP